MCEDRFTEEGQRLPGWIEDSRGARAEKYSCRGSEERNSTFSFRFHCFKFVPFVRIID